MALLVGGIIAGTVGFAGFVLWFGDFLTLLRGGLPFLLLVGGSLTAYIGFDDLQEKLTIERQRQEEALSKAQQDAESAKERADQYREELERLRETVSARTQETS